MKQAMQVKELKKDRLQREIEITVPAADISRHVDVRLQEVSKSVKMPGFRPGKIPLTMLRQRYGRAVLGEVLERVVGETLEKALTDSKLRAAMQPKVDVKSFDEGADLVFTAAFEVIPDITVMDIKSISLDRPVCAPSEAEVTEALTRLAERHRETEVVEAKRGLKTGDTAVFDYEGKTSDGQSYPGMSRKGQWLEMGSGHFIPGFEDGMIGMKAGDTKIVTVTFPDDYQAKMLAGKQAEFTVTLHEIRVQKDAAVDDALAQKVGLEDVASLKAEVVKSLQGDYDYHSRLKVKRALLDALDEAHDFDLPTQMVDIEFNAIVQQMEDERRQNPAEDEGPLTDEEKDELRSIAERRVRLGLVLAEIGKANSITISNQELQRALYQQAANFPGQEKMVFEYYRKNPQALESLRAPIYEEKIVDFILGLAKVTDKTVTAEELKAEDESEAPATKKKAKAAPKKAAKKADDAEASEEAPKKAAKGKKAAE